MRLFKRLSVDGRKEIVVHFSIVNLNSICSKLHVAGLQRERTHAVSIFREGNK